MVGLLGNLGGITRHSCLAAFSPAVCPNTWQMEPTPSNSLPRLPVCCVSTHHGDDPFQGLLTGPVESQIFGGLDCEVALF